VRHLFRLLPIGYAALGATLLFGVARAISALPEILGGL